MPSISSVGLSMICIYVVGNWTLVNRRVVQSLTSLITCPGPQPDQSSYSSSLLHIRFASFLAFLWIIIESVVCDHPSQSFQIVCRCNYLVTKILLHTLFSLFHKHTSLSLNKNTCLVTSSFFIFVIFFLHLQPSSSLHTPPSPSPYPGTSMSSCPLLTSIDLSAVSGIGVG